MSGGTVRVENVKATRELIMTAAERLFAERGVYAVSNRQISLAAGQGNTAAVSYHFGTRDGLVRAIAHKHTERIEQVTRRLLAEIGDSWELRDWVSCLACALPQYLAGQGSPTWYARFCAQVMVDPVLHEVVVDETITPPAQWQVLEGVHRCLPDLPVAVRAERTAMTRHICLSMCAEYEHVLAHGSALPGTGWRSVAIGLVDAIVGLWQAPVTDGS
ncbi:TetR/AcrR family transcriptional regulator [Streptomyces sp. NPDC090075]|uniref:TetR/AcrR family transcriptional regulator n=1 Tax=Streptomyces sp. NPDC090075 TaxID=3365937 RepID=UPI003829ADEA